MTGHYTQADLARIDRFANFHMLREDALAVTCPQCAAAVGQLCINPITGEPIRAPAHWQRIRAAKQHPEET